MSHDDRCPCGGETEWAAVRQDDDGWTVHEERCLACGRLLATGSSVSFLLAPAPPPADPGRWWADLPPGIGQGNTRLAFAPREAYVRNRRWSVRKSLKKSEKRMNRPSVTETQVAGERR